MPAACVAARNCPVAAVVVALVAALFVIGGPATPEAEGAEKGATAMTKRRADTCPRAADSRRIKRLVRARRCVPPRLSRRTQPATVFGLAANGAAALRSAEAALEVRAGVVGVFTGLTEPFPAAGARLAAERKAALMVSLEPHVPGAGQDQPAFALDRITAGAFDADIRRFARDAAATRLQVFVRFAAEMNGDWQVWSTGANGNEPGDYAAAYRHVVQVARAAGGTNIRWVFNPIVSYEGSEPLAQLYPGDAYVDWVALDGYNWGSLKPWGWQSFTDIFALGLRELRSVAPDKPLAIAEIGCAPGPGRAAWVTDALQQARTAGARMLVWFEHDKETDWRLSSDAAAAAAARAVVTGPGWTTGAEPRPARL